MADRNSWPSYLSRKDSATAARNHTSKLKSWFTGLYSRASNPLLLNRHSPHAKIHTQHLSTLPLEIRRQIYTHVLHSYGTVQHILLSDGKLTRMRCASPISHIYSQDSNIENDICNTYDTTYRKSMQNGWEIMPLLLSCRQIYLEFIEIIYSSITFRLPIDAATKFIATVPTLYIALTHLHLNFSILSPMYTPLCVWPVPLRAVRTNLKADEAEWEAFWCAFAHLQVRALVVEILDHGMLVPEQVLLEPLRKVRAEEFEVVLPWSRRLETHGEFENAAFTVRRAPKRTALVGLDVENGYTGVPRRRAIWERLRRRRRW